MNSLSTGDWLRGGSHWQQCFCIVDRGRAVLVAVVLSSFSALSGAQSPVGQWIAADPTDKDLHAVISLQESDGKLFGTLVKVIDKNGNEVHRTCEQCHHSIDGKPLAGLVFIRNLTPRASDGRWTGGRVFDLRPGWKLFKDANCELYVRQGNLHFIGSIGPFSVERVWPAYVPKSIDVPDTAGQ